MAKGSVVYGVVLFTAAVLGVPVIFGALLHPAMVNPASKSANAHNVPRLTARQRSGSRWFDGVRSFILIISPSKVHYKQMALRIRFSTILNTSEKLPFVSILIPFITL
jgi:hypothetical protein